MTATQIYNNVDGTGDTMEYTVEIQSPLINSIEQEIRVALQWQWESRLGFSSERVAFYGEVRRQRFDEFRVDNSIKNSDSYKFANQLLPALPRNTEQIPAQKSKDLDKYVFVEADGPEISILNQTARFTFQVKRNEPALADNKVYMNWGVFDDPLAIDVGAVQGSAEPHDYEISPVFADFLDRVFFSAMLNLIGYTGILTYWFALPL